ncbi:hypothetical protein SESBI_01970 [Sesbania bispinosa]|nr:hypothetical protein SESBI_01970 [Sesbania bispinosa]
MIIGKDSTTRLEWKPSLDSFNFGSFGLVDPSSSCNLKIEEVMDKFDNFCCDQDAHRESPTINRHRLEVLFVATIEDALDNASSSLDAEGDLFGEIDKSIVLKRKEFVKQGLLVPPRRRSDCSDRLCDCLDRIVQIGCVIEEGGLIVQSI